VPFNVLFFEYLQDLDREYLARSWLSDPDVEPPAGPSGKKQPPWNGVDYFFLAGGHSEWRNWDDMRRYGFVSAGHGVKYRRAMASLPVGARVWAAIPGTGYVGVGEVTAEAVPVKSFTVELDGQVRPLLDAPLIAANMGEAADDPDQSEYVTRVRWFDTRPSDQAVWEKGMYANQNVVTKLRHPVTLQRLTETFQTEPQETD
jgi:hypothetical protein